MKRFLTITNSIFLVVVLALSFASIVSINKIRAVEESAALLVYVSEARSALSVFMAERGVYPNGERLILGKENAAVLCVGEDNNTVSGFFSSAQECNGKVVMRLNEAAVTTPLLYSSKGSSYSMDFILAHPLGAYKIRGDYCATERGIVVGRCG